MPEPGIPADIQATARRDGGELVLSGIKQYVVDGVHRR